MVELQDYLKSTSQEHLNIQSQLVAINQESLPLKHQLAELQNQSESTKQKSLQLQTKLVQLQEQLKVTNQENSLIHSQLSDCNLKFRKRLRFENNFTLKYLK